MMYKILYGYCGLNKDKFFTFERSRTRGSAIKLVQKRCKRKVRNDFFVNRTIPHFEILRRKQAIPPKLSTFKGILVRYLQSWDSVIVAFACHVYNCVHFSPVLLCFRAFLLFFFFLWSTLDTLRCNKYQYQYQYQRARPAAAATPGHAPLLPPRASSQSSRTM